MLPVMLAVMLVAPSVQAMGLALQGGRFTPSGSVRGLLDSQWQLGVRALVPPFTPLGVIPGEGLALDLGVDWAVQDVSRASTDGLATKRANVTAIYRYTVPVDETVALYAGMGGRASVLWGAMSEELKSGSLWNHLRGALSVTGGLDWMFAPGLCVDLRASYGVLGFTAWEATGGLLLMF
jgi:hypothetical protein